MNNKLPHKLALFNIGLYLAHWQRRGTEDITHISSQHCDLLCCEMCCAQDNQAKSAGPTSICNSSATFLQHRMRADYMVMVKLRHVIMHLGPEAAEASRCLSSLLALPSLASAASDTDIKLYDVF